MARRKKVHVRDFGPRRSASVATTLQIEVAVSRGTHSKKNAYEACAVISKRGHTRIYSRDYYSRAACGTGAAPRRAMAQALKHLAENITSKRRSSAFRGSR
jgi:hypothetical protein